MVRDFYCGVRDPRGKRYGSMEECAEAGEVRYYGLNKIDRRLVAAHSDSKKNEKTRQELITKLIVYRAKFQKFTDDLKFAKTKKETDEIKKKIDEFDAKKKATIAKIKFIDESKKKPSKEHPKKEPSKKAPSKDTTKKAQSKSPSKDTAKKTAPVRSASTKKSASKEPPRKAPSKDSSKKTTSKVPPKQQTKTKPVPKK